MKKIVAVFIILVTALAGYTQTSISGKVKDNKGNPVAGASISLKDSYDGTISDSLGHYKFTTTEKGEFILLVSNIGYKSFEQKITIGPSPLVFAR